MQTDIANSPHFLRSMTKSNGFFNRISGNHSSLNPKNACYFCRTNFYVVPHSTMLFLRSWPISFFPSCLLQSEGMHLTYTLPQHARTHTHPHAPTRTLTHAQSRAVTVSAGYCFKFVCTTTLPDTDSTPQTTPYIHSSVQFSYTHSHKYVSRSSAFTVQCHAASSGAFPHPEPS